MLPQIKKIHAHDKSFSLFFLFFFAYLSEQEAKIPQTSDSTTKHSAKYKSTSRNTQPPNSATTIYSTFLTIKKRSDQIHF